MKIKKGFILRRVGSQTVVAAVGEASREFNGLIRLNDTGGFMWKLLSGGTSEEELLSAVLSEYDIDEETAKSDVSGFIKKLREAGLLEE